MYKLILIGSLLVGTASSLWASKGDYKYVSSTLTSPGTVTLSGVGYDWFVQAIGGAVTFNINGGQSIVLASGASMSGNFPNLGSPSINITAVGSSTQVVMEGISN